MYTHYITDISCHPFLHLSCNVGLPQCARRLDTFLAASPSQVHVKCVWVCGVRTLWQQTHGSYWAALMPFCSPLVRCSPGCRRRYEWSSLHTCSPYTCQSQLSWCGPRSPASHCRASGPCGTESFVSMCCSPISKQFIGLQHTSEQTAVSWLQIMFLSGFVALKMQPASLACVYVSLESECQTQGCSFVKMDVSSVHFEVLRVTLDMSIELLFSSILHSAL